MNPKRGKVGTSIVAAEGAVLKITPVFENLNPLSNEAKILTKEIGCVTKDCA